MLLRRSLLATGSLLTATFEGLRAASASNPPDGVPNPGASVADQVPSRERVMQVFRQSVMPDDRTVNMRLLRFRRTVSFLVVGPQTSWIQQVVAAQLARLLAHTGLVAVARDTGEDGQIFVLLVPQLDASALDAQHDLLRAFWGGRDRDLATAQSAFAAEAALPLARSTHAVLRWLADQDGSIQAGLVVVETGPYTLVVTTRLRREIARAFGIQGYGLETGHSLFNLNSMALDLTAIDLRVLRTLYDPAITPGLGREASLREVSRLLEQQRG